MIISIIAAVAKNRAIGYKNKLLYSIGDDMKRFKALTTGHTVIMGRKTFESFPKPLPNRTHIIITRQKNYQAEGCIIVDSIEKALSICPKDEDSFIIGGGEIYTLGLAYTDKIEITRVHSSFEADAYFPEINKKDWKLEKYEFNEKDEKHKYDYTYETYIRK